MRSSTSLVVRCGHECGACDRSTKLARPPSRYRSRHSRTLGREYPYLSAISVTVNRSSNASRAISSLMSTIVLSLIGIAPPAMSLTHGKHQPEHLWKASTRTEPSPHPTPNPRPWHRTFINAERGSEERREADHHDPLRRRRRSRARRGAGEEGEVSGPRFGADRRGPDQARLHGQTARCRAAGEEAGAAARR